MNGIKLYVLAVLSNLGMLWILNLGNKGEAGEGDTGGDAKTFTQEQVNHMMAEHKRTLQADVVGSNEMISQLQNDLKKYKEAEEIRTQSKLEEQKEYEKLKDGWGTKENEYKSVIDTQKETIKDMKVTSALTEAVIRQNSHSDTIQLIKPLVSVDEKGNIFIQGKDANGIDQQLSVEEGIKAFLKERPYLVKATGNGGGGTPAPGDNGVGGNTDNSDPFKDANDLQAAMRSGDRKKINEVKSRIAAKKAQASPVF